MIVGGGKPLLGKLGLYDLCRSHPEFHTDTEMVVAMLVVAVFGLIGGYLLTILSHRTAVTLPW